MPGTVLLIDPDGVTRDVPEDVAQGALQRGWRAPTADDTSAASTSAANERDYGGIHGALGAIGGGVARGLTLGTSDLAARAIGGQDATDTLEGIRALHPYTSGASEIVGTLLPAVLTGGAATPAGIAATIGRRAAAGATREGAGVLGRVAGHAIGAAAEGSLYGGGQYLSETALENKPLSAEGFIGGMGKGALFAAPVGGTFALAGETLQRARSLFPRSEVTTEAAAAVKSDATAALRESLTDGDTMAETARRRIEMADAQAGAAGARTQVTRRVFGGGDPAVLGAQVDATANKAQLVEALQKLETSQIALKDWIAAGGPDLEEALATLDGAGATDPRLSAALKALIERPETLGSGGVPQGEFGRRLAGRTAVDPDGLPTGASNAPTEPAPATNVIRKGAGSAPARTALDDIAATPASGSAVERAPSLDDIGGGAPSPRAVESTRVLRGGVPVAQAEHAADDVAREAIASMNELQLNKLQDDLNEQFKRVKPGDPEHKALSDLMDHVQEAQRPFFDKRFGSVGAETAPSAGSPHGDDMIALHHSMTTYEGATGEAFPPVEAPSSLFKEHGYYEVRGAAEHEPGAPVMATVSPSGKIVIHAGHDDLAAAIKSGEPIEVEWSSGPEPATGAALHHGPGADAGGAATAPSGGEVVRFGRPTARKMEIREHGAAPRQVSNDEARDWAESQMPPGFKPGNLETHRDFSIEHGLPSDYGAVRENSVYITTPRALAEHGIQGNEIHVEHAARMAEARASGIKLTPIDVMVTKDGKWFVEDGNHRLQQAAAGDAPVAVRFRQANDLWKPQSGTRDISERVRAELPKSTAAPATDTLTGLLRGTKSKLDEGANLNDIGAPARGEYAAGKSERTAAAREHFRSEANAKNFAASEMGAAERAAQPGMGGAEQATNVGRRPASTAPADVKLTEMLGSEHPALPEARGEIGKMFGIDMAPEAAEQVGSADDLKALLSSWSDSTAGTTVDRGMRARMSTVADDAAIERLLQKRAGKNVDIGPQLAQAAKLIGDHEAASSEVAGLLGADAPKTAVHRAQAYRAARAAQAEAQGASAAKAAQGIQDRAVPAMGSSRTEVSSDVAKALQKHESAIEGAKDRALVSMQRAETKAAAKAAASPAPARAGGLGGKLADVGTALEVMKALGVHVPVLSAIPVIGPVLGLFFKARAALSILGRKGGSIGRSTEGLIAATSAATRERLASATQAILTGAGKGALKLSEISAGPAVTLGYKLFPGPGVTKSKDPVKLYEARMDEIARAQQPGAIDHAISDRYQTGDPKLHDAMVGQVQRGIAFLDSKAPKPTILQSMLPGDGVWRPSKAQLDEWGKYVHAVGDPASVLEDLAKGHVTLEGAETLRVVYPELFAEGQRLLLQAAPQMQKSLPYPTRVAISILYRIPVDGSMQPGHLQYLQQGQIPASGAPAGGPPGAGGAAPPASPPSLTGPIKLGQSTMTSLDHRAES